MHCCCIINASTPDKSLMSSEESQSEISTGSESESEKGSASESEMELPRERQLKQQGEFMLEFFTGDIF